MSKQLVFSSEKRPLVDELMLVQSTYNRAREEENELLGRLSEVDLFRLWDRLGVSPCHVCYHGGHNRVETECSLFSRCRSFIEAKSMKEDEVGNILVDVAIIFQVTE